MTHFSKQSEENYLKTLFKLGLRDIKKLNNTTLAKEMDLNPATVLEMVRKMTAQGLVDLLPDKRLQLTEKGKRKALLVIRKHRIWEVFLVQKLHYNWTEVHQLAEQLEHVESEDLIDRLDAYLGHPPFDPHGDPIPDKRGKLHLHASIPLLTGQPGNSYVVANLAETADSFLAYLEKLGIKPGSVIKLKELNEYDHSLIISIQKKTIHLSEKVAANILVKPITKAPL